MYELAIITALVAAGAVTDLRLVARRRTTEAEASTEPAQADTPSTTRETAGVA